MPFFTPPSVRYQIPTDDPWWQYFTADHGLTIIQHEDDTLTVVETLTTDEYEAAKNVYLGGHIYSLSDAEAAFLTGAGYGDQITDYDPGIPDTSDPTDSGYGVGGYGVGGYGE